MNAFQTRRVAAFHVSVLALVISFTCLPSSSFAQAEGSWGGGGKDEKPEPPAKTHIASDKKSLAQGDMKGILVKGGPAGVYVWGHLHGRHPGYTGETQYVGTIAVVDESGYEYVVSPVIDETVRPSGKVGEANRDKHFYIQVKPTGQSLNDIKGALDSGTKLSVRVDVHRSRDDFKWATKELSKALAHDPGPVLVS